MHPKNTAEGGTGFDVMLRPSVSWHSRSDFREQIMQAGPYAVLVLFQACSAKHEIYEVKNYYAIIKRNAQRLQRNLKHDIEVSFLHNKGPSDCHFG